MTYDPGPGCCIPALGILCAMALAMLVCWIF